MAALGAIPGIYDPAVKFQPTHTPISDYQINRGSHLGAVTVRSATQPINKTPTVANYIIRQIRILYRQLWPQHGQRFPQ